MLLHVVHMKVIYTSCLVVLLYEIDVFYSFPALNVVLI